VALLAILVAGGNGQEILISLVTSALPAQPCRTD
jgi:hypothetical protein